MRFEAFIKYALLTDDVARVRMELKHLRPVERDRLHEPGFWRVRLVGNLWLQPAWWDAFEVPLVNLHATLVLPIGQWPFGHRYDRLQLTMHLERLQGELFHEETEHMAAFINERYQRRRIG
jgi:hypothetical protein